jgi:hypothetical protein
LFKIGKYIVFFLSLCLSCVGLSTEFSLDTYPPSSKPENGNWEYVLEIEVCPHFTGSFLQYGEREFRISIYDASNNNFFKSYKTFLSGEYRRIVKWNSFDSIDFQIVNTRYDTIYHKFIDSTFLLHELLVFNKASNKFAVDTIYNDQSIKRKKQFWK